MTRPLEQWIEGELDAYNQRVAEASTSNQILDTVIQAMKKQATNAKLSEEVQQEFIRKMAQEECKRVVAPPHPRMFTSDATEERLFQRMHIRGGEYAVLSGEGRPVFDAIMGKYSGKERTGDAIYLAGLSGDTITRDRVGNENGPEDRMIVNPCLNVCVMVQPDKYLEAARHPSLRASGALARIWPVWLPSLVGTRLEEADEPGLNEFLLQSYEETILGLLNAKVPAKDDKPACHLVRLSPEARESRRHWHNTVEMLMAEGRDLEDVRDIASKAVSATAKAALVLHLLERPHLLTEAESELDLATWQRAQRLGEYHLTEAVRVQRWAEGDALECTVLRVTQWALKTGTGLIGLLAALDSGQWSLVREAVDQSSAVLRHGGIDAATHAKIGQHLVKLATHPKWEVRKALAHAVLHLRHETFDRIMAVLDKDTHDLVRNAARRTLSRRSEISRSDLLKDQHGDLMLQWLEELEAKHGPRARNAARRVAEKLHAQFVKELNHELIKVISPLDASLTNIENAVLANRMPPDELVRHLRRAQDRVLFLNSVLDSLRALTQDVDLEFQVESLRSMVEEAVHLVRDRKKENTPLTADIQVDPTITVESNRHLLLQALTNIIQNSLDAYTGSRRKPEIMITAAVYNGTRIQMILRDHGCGMSEEAVGDAFQLFATSKPHGLGFGLTIAKKIIETDHNGMVYLESVKSHGTTVTITLPIEQETREW